MEQQRNRAGRPPLADLEHLRSQLLELIEASGYEQTSMSALARSVEMSVRTLHRYFPAKADIVWGGIEISVEALTAELAAVARETPTLEAIASAVSNVFGRSVEDMEVMRARLRLIARSPELRMMRSATFEAWKRVVIRYVAVRRNEPDDALIPVTAGAAIHTVIMEALTWWGMQDQPLDPSQCISHALSQLSGINSM